MNKIFFNGRDFLSYFQSTLAAELHPNGTFCASPDRIVQQFGSAAPRLQKEWLLA